MAPTILEREPRSGGEIAHGSTHEHLTGTRQRADACSDVDGDTAPVVAALLALADVNPRPNPNAPNRERRDKLERAAGRFGWAVEDGEHAVARVLDPASPEARQVTVGDL